MFQETLETIMAEDGAELAYLFAQSKGPHDTSKGKSVFISVHGLTGHPDEEVHREATTLFCQAGIDVVKPYLYGDADKQRKLVDNSLQQNADDICAFVAHFSKAYERVFVAGHSYGGLGLMMANDPRITAAAFWDSSFVPYQAFWKDMAMPIEGAQGLYTITFGGVAHVVHQNMIEEARIVDQKADQYAQDFKAPALVVLAGDSCENPVRTQIYDALPSKLHKKLVDIKGADHCFWRGDTSQTLAKETLEWFQSI